MYTPALFPCARRLTALLLGAAPLHAAITIAPMTSFGGGDGWRAPGEILAGDAGDSNNGTAYNFLGTASLERGFAYNPASDILFLVSRNGGSHVRQLIALTGVDAGPINLPASVTGGFFAVNQAACDSSGALYVSNLTLNAATTNFKIYKWTDSGDAPVEFFSGLLTGFTGTPRFGDTLALANTPSGPVLAAGGNGVTGYVIVDAAGATQLASFTPAGVAAGDFVPGITFGSDGAGSVWGKRNGGTTGRRTSYTAAAGTYSGTLPLLNAEECAMDAATVGTIPLLATLEMNSASPLVRVYDVSNPAAPSLAGGLTTASGALTANSNRGGAVKWGKITAEGAVTTATLYALCSNRGLQAFTVTITPDAAPPAIASSPASRTAFERGQTTFTVSATGTPPLTYQWLKGGEVIPGATSSSYTINPVTAASAGSYTCRVSNSATPPAESVPATLTVDPGLNTGALTQCWQLSPGSRPYLSEGDFQRGLGCNAASGKLYLANRANGPAVHVLDAATGDDAGTLDMTSVSGGTFVLNSVAVAGDGAIYVCNLSNTGDGSGFKIYQWPDDQPATPPTVAYEGNPAGLRTGDCITARGSGADTRILAGTNADSTTNHFVVFAPNEIGYFNAYPVTVEGAAARAFSLGIAFGPDNTVWGKGNGTGITVARLTLDLAAVPPVATATLLTVITGASIPASGGAIAIDANYRCLAHLHTGNSDNVRLYRLPASLEPPPTALEWLDQEFFATDNANQFAVGQAVFAGDKLYVLNTNNGLACYTVAKPLPPPPDPVITDVTQSGGSVVFKLKGIQGKTYVIEKSTALTPIATWTPDGTVTQNAVEETVTRPIEPGTPRLYFRAREQATQP